MIDAELQKALKTALAAVPALGSRIYDGVPENPVFPYATIGDEQVLDAGNSCSDGWEVFPDVHLWDRPAAGSKLAIKELNAAVVPTVIAISSVTGFTVIVAELESARTLRDRDEVTEHSILTFRFLLDPA